MASFRMSKSTPIKELSTQPSVGLRHVAPGTPGQAKATQGLTQPKTVTAKQPKKGIVDHNGFTDDF